MLPIPLFKIEYISTRQSKIRFEREFLFEKMIFSAVVKFLGALELLTLLKCFTPT